MGTSRPAGLRATVERRTGAVLVLLDGLPRWALPVTLLAVLLAGLALRNWIGALTLALIAMFLSWLAYLSWPSLAVRSRVLRLAGIAVLLAIAASHILAPPAS